MHSLEGAISPGDNHIILTISRHMTDNKIENPEIPISLKRQSWLIKFHEGRHLHQLDDSVSKLVGFNPQQKLRVVHTYDAIPCGINCLVKESRLRALQQHGIIESFEADDLMHITALPERKVLTPEDLQALAAQPAGGFIFRVGANGSSQRAGDGTGSLATRSDLNVFVIDTGIASHPDLNIVGGADFTGSGGFGDGNGHGTHVSGIIGASDNVFGIVGVAPGVRLWAVKVLGANGSGSISGILNGLNWILTGRGTRWTGKAVINMSLGGGVSTTLDNAVAYTISQGIPVCVAAGNSSINASNASPARVLTAITVGASGPNPGYTNLSTYSNYGSVVDIIAPGDRIYSTYLNSGYATLSGTSMATPVVTGALILAMSVTTVPGTGSTYSQNARNLIVNNSAPTKTTYRIGGSANNPRVIIPINKPATNISVWSGIY